MIPQFWLAPKSHSGGYLKSELEENGYIEVFLVRLADLWKKCIKLEAEEGRVIVAEKFQLHSHRRFQKIV
jgi:hypothetical protein